MILIYVIAALLLIVVIAWGSGPARPIVFLLLVYGAIAAALSWVVFVEDMTS